MRSHYDEYARAETKNTTATTTATQYNKMLNTNHNYSNNNNHFTYNNNNNNSNNNYNNSNNNNNSNGSIPYHARENSLPFSYGQISKTSTPLRPTASASAAATTTSSSVSRSYKNGLEHDFDFDFDFDLSSDRYNNNNANNNNDHLLGSHAKTSNGVNGARYALDANHYNPATTDRAKKRIEFLDTSNGGAGVGCTQSLRYNSKSSISADEPDPSMIKVQPRLTSPLLVRKTLGSSNNNNHNSTISRSPTRSSTNTIANTYHYSYGNKNSSGGGGGAGDNFDKFGLNGNISSHNNSSNNNNIYGRNTPTYAGVDTLTTTSKTPARPDFDELLRERREKVFNEYRSTTQEVLTTPPNRSPLPPPRRFINGTVQLPSTLPPNLNNGRGSSLSNYGGAQYGEMGPQVPQRSAGKYNYDFQFNLNLDERQNGLAPNDDGRPRHQTLDRSPVRYRNYHLEQRQNGVAPNNDEVDFVKSPPRHQTLDRSPQRYRSPETVRQHQTLDRFMTTHSRYQDELDSDILRRRPNLAPDAAYGQYQEKQQHQQLYETRNIPLASYNVERNYQQQQQQTTTSSASANAPPASSSSSFMSDIYATPYDDQYASNKSRPLEANTNTNNQLISSTSTTTTIERTNRHDPTPYGNGQIYGQQQAHDGSRGQATTPQMARRRETSPIYATSTKKVTQVAAATTTPTSPAAAPLYRSATPQQHTNAAASTATASMAALNITDYPAASPGGTIRPETPAFPVTPRTPFATNSGVGSSSYNTIQRHNGSVTEIQNYSTETLYGTNYRPRLNSSLSMANSEPQEVAAHLVKFAKDSSKFWYKPNLSRDEALALLLHAPPGTFVVRDSATYKNFYGLVLRVAQPPPGTPSSGRPDELVRHFLIEPTTRGVRLKDCNNEPVFTSLSALIYEHSINRLALPCLLQIPERDIVQPLVEPSPAQTQLLTQGAACNVLWLYSCDTESLTGEEAIRKAMRQMNAPGNKVTPIEVHFKVSHQGITLTDNTRKKFFRKHYTADIISFCAIDPDNRMWTMQEHDNDNTTVVGALKKTIFAFVARRSASSKDNQCHVFCDLAINQPASAIVSFVNKTLPTEKQKNYIL
uniref:SH2 domain-containing protein n=1 Tax=Musca domestica TaxID=7370 RepID=A0A1I8NGN7_MUSDO